MAALPSGDTTTGALRPDVLSSGIPAVWEAWSQLMQAWLRKLAPDEHRLQVVRLLKNAEIQVAAIHSERMGGSATVLGPLIAFVSASNRVVLTDRNRLPLLAWPMRLIVRCTHSKARVCSSITVCVRMARVLLPQS